MDIFPVRNLDVDPNTLEGVASAYRYKLNLKNESLLGAILHFPESLDVFSFTAVDKKRALKKEEWPTVTSVDSPKRFDVQLQLLAGNTEIVNCDGCASWKEKTRKPFLVLTPTGDRCLQYQKNPFILLIFRCCPKFHSCNKQFRLMITITSPLTGETFQNEVNIYRKKMLSTKKRKTTDAIPISIPTLPRIVPPKEALLVPKTIPHVVSPQFMYEMLYSDKMDSGNKKANRNMIQMIETPQPVLHQIKLEPKTKNSFWNFDSHPNHFQNSFPNELSDEQWLNSIFDDLNRGNYSLPRTVDDISALLELPVDQQDYFFNEF